jgi:hypothetical protein
MLEHSKAKNKFNNRDTLVNLNCYPINHKSKILPIFQTLCYGSIQDCSRFNTSLTHNFSYSWCAQLQTHWALSSHGNSYQHSIQNSTRMLYIYWTRMVAITAGNAKEQNITNLTVITYYDFLLLLYTNPLLNLPKLKIPYHSRVLIQLQCRDLYNTRVSFVCHLIKLQAISCKNIILPQEPKSPIFRCSSNKLSITSFNGKLL